MAVENDAYCRGSGTLFYFCRPTLELQATQGKRLAIDLGHTQNPFSYNASFICGIKCHRMWSWL